MKSRTRKVVVIGAGQMGVASAALLARSREYQVRLADVSPEPKSVPRRLLRVVEYVCADAQDPAQVDHAIEGCEAVLCCLPVSKIAPVAEAAVKQGVLYLDLTESHAVTRQIQEISRRATQPVAPQCGLAPGFASMAAADMVRGFDSVENLQVKVGALAQNVSNRWRYLPTWSAEGLVNQYVQPCEAIEDGELRFVKPLEGYELFQVGGEVYECFQTSGGCGSTPRTFVGKVRRMAYKTIRYPGHREYVLFALDDLGLRRAPQSFVEIIRSGVPTTRDDKVIILVEATGIKEGVLTQNTRSIQIYPGIVDNMPLTAIQLSTAAGICGVMDTLISGRHAPGPGFVRVEDIPLDAFLKSKFAFPYGAWTGGENHQKGEE